jgi:hypothetical protein
VHPTQLRRELVNTRLNLVRALFATGRSGHLDDALAELQRLMTFLRAGAVEVRAAFSASSRERRRGRNSEGGTVGDTGRKTRSPSCTRAPLSGGVRGVGWCRRRTPLHLKT